MNIKNEYDEGDLVRVSNKRLKSNGQIGKIEKIISPDLIRIRFMHRIPFMPYQTISIKISNVSKVNGNKIYENEVNNMIKINEPFKVVRIKFIDGNNNGEFCYACFEDEIQVDDYVVVQPAHHPMTVAKVTKIIDEPTQSQFDYAISGREIVAIFDYYAYEERINKRKRKADLKAQMRQMIADNQEELLFAALAETNPKMKELFDVYKSL